MDEYNQIEQLMNELKQLKRQVALLEVAAKGTLYRVQSYETNTAYEGIIFAGATEQECTEYVLDHFGDDVELASLGQIVNKDHNYPGAWLWGRILKTSSTDDAWDETYQLFMAGGINRTLFIGKAA